MQTKSVIYAAVGAPVVAARKVGEKVNDLRVKMSDEANGYTKTAEKAIDSWAVEGEKVVGRITDGKVVDEIASKVDLDQAKEQVTKLRDQLEDMLATWRTSFRPEKSAEKSEVSEVKAPAKKPAARKPAAKANTAKASAAKTTKPSAAKTTKSTAAKTTKSTAAKTSSAKPAQAGKTS